MKIVFKNFVFVSFFLLNFTTLFHQIFQSEIKSFSFLMFMIYQEIEFNLFSIFLVFSKIFFGISKLQVIRRTTAIG
jgi:hypothetical protein